MFSDETKDQIERRALEIAAVIEAKRGPFRAEMIPECAAQWHVITTAPMAEGIAAQHLVDRGFGIYRPTFNRARVVRGRLRDFQTSLFPGHIFLFVWDALLHWRRIRACPGITGILTVDERPVVVDDSAIYRMQVIEFNGIIGGMSVPAIPKRKRRRKDRWSEQIERADDDFAPTISARSYWTGIEKLDDHARISVLHKALGLAS